MLHFLAHLLHINRGFAWGGMFYCAKCDLPEKFTKS